MRLDDLYWIVTRYTPRVTPYSPSDADLLRACGIQPEHIEAPKNDEEEETERLRRKFNQAMSNGWRE